LIVLRIRRELIITNKDAEIEQLYDQLFELHKYFGGTMTRRALSLVSTVLEQRKDSKPVIQCGGPRDPIDDWPGCLPGEPCRKPNAGEPLPYDEVFREFMAEDRRRSTFLDPVESLSAQLVDHYLGRTKVLEVRKGAVNLDDIATSVHEKAIQTLNQRHASIVAIRVTEADPLQTIENLRSLASALEKDYKSSVTPTPPTVSLAPLDRQKKCQLIRTEVGKSRWREGSNSRVREQQFRDVFSCNWVDSCCENTAWTEIGEWEWRLVWEDGDPNSHPPANPDPFQKRDWDNRCRVFESVKGEITSDRGWREGPGGVPQWHNGLDIGVPVGTNVLNVELGIVAHVNRHATGGKTGVYVRSGNILRQYWHVDPAGSIEIGQEIQAGQLLGVTANYPRPHLHFARYNQPGTGSDWNLPTRNQSVDACP